MIVMSDSCSSICSKTFFSFNHCIFFFFFQAEDGIRDVAVTGVQTCALPIYSGCLFCLYPDHAPILFQQKETKETKIVFSGDVFSIPPLITPDLLNKRKRSEIGRASCRERV